MRDAVERAQALLASMSALQPYDHPDVLAEHALLRRALGEVLAELSESRGRTLKALEIYHEAETDVDVETNRAARWKAVAKRLFAFRSRWRRMTQSQRPLLAAYSRAIDDVKRRAKAKAARKARRKGRR